LLLGVVFTALVSFAKLEGRGLQGEGQMQSMENKPAGWYRNSEDRRQHGYWDGLAWDTPSDEDTTAAANDLDVPDDPIEPDQPEVSAAPQD